MAYDIEEQDTLENLKALWQRYGTVITGLLLAALIGLGAWNGWQYWQKKQANEAAILYDQLRNAWLNKDAPKVLRAAQDIQSKFPRTAYAQLAALSAAKASADTGDIKTAKAQLTWASEQGKNSEIKHIAHLRLATILLEEKDYAAALKLLTDPAPPGFEALYAERRGDIFFAQEKISEARAAYQLAFDKVDAHANEQRQIINLKLDLVGNP